MSESNFNKLIIKDQAFDISQDGDWIPVDDYQSLINQYNELEMLTLSLWIFSLLENERWVSKLERSKQLQIALDKVKNFFLEGKDPWEVLHEHFGNRGNQ